MFGICYTLYIEDTVRKKNHSNWKTNRSRPISQHAQHRIVFPEFVSLLFLSQIENKFNGIEVNQFRFTLVFVACNLYLLFVQIFDVKEKTSCILHQIHHCRIVFKCCFFFIYFEHLVSLCLYIVSVCWNVECRKPNAECRMLHISLAFGYNYYNDVGSSVVGIVFPFFRAMLRIKFDFMFMFSNCCWFGFSTFISSNNLIGSVQLVVSALHFRIRIQIIMCKSLSAIQNEFCWVY